jgi:hypothetical protein
MEEVNHCLLTLVHSDEVCVDVVWVITDDVVVEFALLEHIVLIERDVRLHVGLTPFGGDCEVLPSVVIDALFLCAEVVVVRLILEFHTILSNTPVEGVLDVATVVTDAREDRAATHWADPGRESEAVVKRKHLSGQEVVLPVKEQASVIERIWVILLDRKLTGSTEELHDPGVASARVENLSVGVLPRAAHAVGESEREVGNKASVITAKADRVSADFLESGWAEVEADIRTWCEEISWAALFAMHAFFILILAVDTVGWALTTSVSVIPLVISTGACIARLAV